MTMITDSNYTIGIADMDFSEVLFLLRAGKKVRRAAWQKTWAYVELIDVGDRLPQFAITMDDGSKAVLNINADMVLSADWQEA
jgi:hypothetical protein